MQFNKNTSSGKNNIIGIIIKFILGLVVIMGLVFFLNKIDFPAPKKEIDRIIPNENFKIVK
jgi:capsular polysaccharide biosynthesis protein